MTPKITYSTSKRLNLNLREYRGTNPFELAACIKYGTGKSGLYWETNWGGNSGPTSAIEYGTVYVIYDDKLKTEDVIKDIEEAIASLGKSPKPKTETV